MRRDLLEALVEFAVDAYGDHAGPRDVVLVVVSTDGIHHAHLRPLDEVSRYMPPSIVRELRGRIAPCTVLVLACLELEGGAVDIIPGSATLRGAAA